MSRLMLNLRTQVLKRNPIISSRRLSTRMQGDQYHLSSIYEYSLGKPPPTSRATESGWSAFETSFVGNLGEPIVTFEHEHELDDAYEDSVHAHPDAHYTNPYTPSPHTYPPTPQSTDSQRSSRAHLRRYSTDASSHPYPAPLPDTHDTLSPVPLALSPPPKSRARPHTPSSGSRAPLLPLRRARAADAETIEVRQTRSLPAPLIVEVTEEVVVYTPPPTADAAQPPGGGASLHPPRWLAPQSWRLSSHQGAPEG